MKLAPVTKRDKRNNAISKEKKNLNDFMLENYDFIFNFPIYGQFGAIQKPHSGRRDCKTYILIKSNLLSNKN